MPYVATEIRSGQNSPKLQDFDQSNDSKQVELIFIIKACRQSKNFLKSEQSWPRYVLGNKLKLVHPNLAKLCQISLINA